MTLEAILAVSTAVGSAGAVGLAVAFAVVAWRFASARIARSRAETELAASEKGRTDAIAENESLRAARDAEVLELERENARWRSRYLGADVPDTPEARRAVVDEYDALRARMRRDAEASRVDPDRRPQLSSGTHTAPDG